MKYGWKYIFEPTPKNVSKWLFAIRSIFGAIQATAIISQASIPLQLGIIVVGGILHELGSLIGEDPKKEATEPSQIGTV